MRPRGADWHRVGSRRVGKVDRRLDVGKQVEQVGLHNCERYAGAPREPIERGAKLRGRAGVDDRDNGLRLHEIQPAGEKRPQRELAAAGQPGPVPAGLRDHRFHEHRRAGQLHLRERPTHRPARPRPVQDVYRDLAPLAAERRRTKPGSHKLRQAAGRREPRRLGYEEGFEHAVEPVTGKPHNPPRAGPRDGCRRHNQFSGGEHANQIRLKREQAATPAGGGPETRSAPRASAGPAIATASATAAAAGSPRQPPTPAATPHRQPAHHRRPWPQRASAARATAPRCPTGSRR